MIQVFNGDKMVDEFASWVEPSVGDDALVLLDTREPYRKVVAAFNSRGGWTHFVVIYDD